MLFTPEFFYELTGTRVRYIKGLCSKDRETITYAVGFFELEEKTTTLTELTNRAETYLSLKGLTLTTEMGISGEELWIYRENPCISEVFNEEESRYNILRAVHFIIEWERLHKYETLTS